MVLIRVAGNVLPSISDHIFGHFLEGHVCIGPSELLVANGVGGQAPAGTAETCCAPRVHGVTASRRCMDAHQKMCMDSQPHRAVAQLNIKGRCTRCSTGTTAATAAGATAVAQLQIQGRCTG
jgi:hypothetical protein